MRSSKAKTYLLNGAIILMTVFGIHILETMYGWSQFNYDSFFSVFSDNIGGRSQFQQLTPVLPVDVVYTWVNGSDPKFIKGLRRTKDDLVKTGKLLKLNVTGEGSIYTTHTNDKNVTYLKCALRDCIEVDMLIFEPKSPVLELSRRDVMTAVTELNAATDIMVPDVKSGVGPRNTTSIVIAVIPDHETIQRILTKTYDKFIVHQAYFTSTNMLEGLMQWGDTVLLSNLQPSLHDEAQIARVLPSDVLDDLSQIREFSKAKVATVKFHSGQAAEDTLNYFYQNPAVLGQVQINPCFLLWDLKAIEPDPEWLSASRFADNEEMKYSLRSLEKFAPWIRHVFIVTNGQIPSWLNLEAPRLTVITHEQLFPSSEYLPTYSSPAIESQLHKIPGLSKYFLYFNDDVMLGQPVYPGDFYSDATGFTVYQGWPVPSCSDQCPSSWLHDGYCDAACNTADCDFDGGDCSSVNAGGGQGVLGGAGGARMDTGCAPSCSDTWLGDRYCDTTCNKASCGFDMGDCGVASFQRLPVFHVDSRVENDQVLAFTHLVAEEASFLLNLTDCLTHLRKNVSAVQYEKSAYIRAVKYLVKPHLLQVLLSSLSPPTDEVRLAFVVDLTGVFRFNVSVRLDFTPVQAPNSKYENLVAEFDPESIAGFESPKRVEKLPTVAPNFVMPDDSLVERLPKNVSSYLSKLRQWRANETIADSVYKLLASDLLAPYASTLQKAPKSPQKAELLKSPEKIHNAEKPQEAPEAIVEKPVEKVDPEDNVEPAGNARPDEAEEAGAENHQEAKAEPERLVKSETRRKRRELSENDPLLLDQGEHEAVFAPAEAPKFNESEEEPAADLTKDTFRESLRFVNKLYDETFGSSGQRMVISHMPHFIDKDIMIELQERFPKQFEATSHHRVRMRNDMQFAFAYFQYIMSVKEPTNYMDTFEYFDSDGSGVLSDRELRVLATHMYPIPITLNSMNDLESELKKCASDQAKEGIVETPPRNPEKYYSPDMPQVTVMLLFNCRAMLDRISSSFTKPKTKYKYQAISDSELVMFKMLPSNLSHLVGILDDVRHKRKKFICLNDNFDHNQQDAPVARAVIQDFYEGIFPVPSQFELPREYRNRFLHVDELNSWQSFRWQLKLWSHVLLGVLVVVSVGSYLQDKFELFYEKVVQKPKFLPK